jgi:hypothetical protein
MGLDARSPVAPGFALITTQVCSGGVFDGAACSGVFQEFTLQHFGKSDRRNIFLDSVSFPPTNIINVRTTFLLDANGASSQINGVGYVVNTPEPATVAVVGFGLAAAAAFRRRLLRRTTL